MCNESAARERKSPRELHRLTRFPHVHADRGEVFRSVREARMGETKAQSYFPWEARHLGCCKPRTPGGVLGDLPARRWSTSQPEDQVAYGSGLREEWVVAGVEFYDATRPASELALPIGRGSLVFGAHEVRRGDVLPGR